MEPMLRGSRDYVLAAPVTAYQGDGLYIVDTGLGAELYRVTSSLDRRLVLTKENPIYEPHFVDREVFDERVMGKVVADIRTRDERLLRDC